MLWAIVNNKKVEATPKAYGSCPLCSGLVLAKCGEIKIWHWAHAKDADCDTWYEPESDWHYHWKMTFGKEQAEVVIKKQDKWHIADILTEGAVVIELQHSPIQNTIIRKREEFYGDKMLWLVDGSPFKHNFFIKDWNDASHSWSHQHDNTSGVGGEKTFQWDYARKS